MESLLQQQSEEVRLESSQLTPSSSHPDQDHIPEQYQQMHYGSTASPSTGFLSQRRNGLQRGGSFARTGRGSPEVYGETLSMSRSCSTSPANTPTGSSPRYDMEHRQSSVRSGLSHISLDSALSGASAISSPHPHWQQIEESPVNRRNSVNTSIDGSISSSAHVRQSPHCSNSGVDTSVNGSGDLVHTGPTTHPYYEHDTFAVPSSRATDTSYESLPSHHISTASTDDVSGDDELHDAPSPVTEQRPDVDLPQQQPDTNLTAHPTAAELLDYYRRTFREASQRSLQHHGSNGTGSVAGGRMTSGSLSGSGGPETTGMPAGESDHLPSHGVLNRGGVVSFQHLQHQGNQAQGPQSLTGTVNSSSHHHRRGSSRPSSSRSLDSMSSFGEEVNASILNSNDAESAPSDTSFRESSAVSQDPGVARIQQAGVDFVEVLNTLRDLPDSLRTQTAGLHVLSELTLSEEDSETLLNIGVVQVILDAMRRYADDTSQVELQTAACRAILNVTGTSEAQINFVQNQTVEHVSTLMQNLLENATVQEYAMATIANLSVLEANLPILIEEHSVTRIVEAMNKHSENRQVQIKGCSAITNMASHTTPLKKTIMDQGGGGAVVVSMVMHPGDVELQEKALQALRNLSANSDENKMELARIGGIESVIGAMQVHRDEAGIQKTGSWSLSNLAGFVDNKRIIGECGGVDVIVRAMWVHSDEVSVQEWCCRALFTLALEPQNRLVVLDVGGISAVVNAMQAHVDSSTVQEMGCAVLCNLATDQATKLRIVDEEALDAIVLAMVLFGDEIKVQQQGCQILSQLCVAENLKSLQASNAGELALAAAHKFPECDAPAQWLLNSLEEFAAAYIETTEAHH